MSGIVSSRMDAMDVLGGAVEHAERMLAMFVLNWMEHGVVYRMCDFAEVGIEDKTVTQVLHSLEKQGCVRFYRFGHIQVVARIDYDGN